ncbi:MAG: hypothetical protein EOO07_31560, partial [Chitinophagaceae bacterium]
NKVAITGTPIENNTFDLYGQLSFACPGLFGSKQQFADLYSTPIDQFKDSKRAKELQNKIKPFILRRTKEQVAKELPDKTEIILYCEMGTEQKEVYEANKKEIQDYILGKSEDELPKSSMHVLRSITRLRQICNSAALLADGKSYLQASSKIDVLIEQIESKAQNHKILIFSQFVGMLDLIKRRLAEKEIKYQYLTGQTKNRGEVVKEFQSNNSIPVFLISLKAGGTGLNLTEADYVYLVDPWWNPAVENQAIDRAYRIGQHKNVMAIRLICPDTIEEKIMKLQAVKKDLVKDLIQTDGSFFKGLTKKGSRAYLWNRFVRLGIPFLVAEAVLIPLAYWPSFYEATHSTNLIAFLKDYIITQRWPVGPPWFIWLLFAFDGVAVFIFMSKPTFFVWAGHHLDRLSQQPIRFGSALYGLVALSLIPLSLWVGQYT